jgi:hypothetical protein
VVAVAEDQLNAGRAPQAPLENHCEQLFVFPSEQVRKRRDRYAMRSAQWRASELRRCRHCGRVPRSNADGVTLRASDGIAGYAGLQTCGSVWACPVCAPKILVHRALEIGSVLAAAINEGHVLGFFTLTMRHHDRQALELLWKAAGKGWTRATSGEYWMIERDACGVVGWVRVWELTIGPNGWHLHVHGVLVLNPGATNSDLDRVAGGMFKRWSRGLVSAGLEAPLLRGQEWHLVSGDQAADEVAGYLFKIAEQVDIDQATSLGLELTHTMPGRSKSVLSTRPVWSLLDDLMRDGEADTLRLWNEYERVSKGKRQVGYSQGLRARFAPDVEEMTDEQVADQEHGSNADDLLHFDVNAWRQIATTAGLAVAILEATESGGVTAARTLLDAEGVNYQLINHQENDR